MLGRAWLLLALVACAPDFDREHTPHAHLLEEPELMALPDHQVPPPAPLRAPGDRPDRVVYGYWPYWGDPLDTLYWDQLTHVAIFSVGLNSNGTLNNTSRWTSNAAAAVQRAAPYGVKVHLCMTSFSDATTNSVLSNPSYRATAISAMASLVNQYGAHGVNVDIEGLDGSQNANMVSFIRELQAAVDEVFIAVPAVDWAGAYDYQTLANDSHGLFIMGYDYHWGGGGPGPVAPLYGGGRWSVYSLDWTVDDYLYWGAPADKLILGLPLYGRNWPTTSTYVPGTSTGTASALVWSQTANAGSQYTRYYDTTAETPYAFPTSTSQLWYEDLESMDAKLQYAVDRQLQGFGFWALTYDDASLPLWTIVDEKSHDQCADSDGDGVDDCSDTCPNDPAKSAPGVCGCGISDADSDADGWANCQETCDNDPAKTAPGVCGCGVADSNSDGDSLLDCQETCDADPAKTSPGVCGCGVADTNSDGDSLLDCQETCDTDPAKTAPGVCGCGLPDEDLTGDGVPDCTVCGDAVVEAPETCDDGGRVAGDGCSFLCQREALVLQAVTPPAAGVINHFVATGVANGQTVLFLASGNLGTTPVPGCPGLTVPLQGPLIVGTGQGQGGQAHVQRVVPLTMAGRGAAVVAVDLAGCRVSAPRAVVF
jgi:cysteine-rich repeat protein